MTFFTNEKLMTFLEQYALYSVLYNVTLVTYKCNFNLKN